MNTNGFEEWRASGRFLQPLTLHSDTDWLYSLIYVLKGCFSYVYGQIDLFYLIYVRLASK